MNKYLSESAAGLRGSSEGSALHGLRCSFQRDSSAPGHGSNRKHSASEGSVSECFIDLSSTRKKKIAGPGKV